MMLDGRKKPRPPKFRSDAQQLPLTKRQIEILQWAALGKSAMDTAAILGLSYYTVREHRRLAMERLGVSTIEAAICKMCAAGLAKPL